MMFDGVIDFFYILACFLSSYSMSFWERGEIFLFLFFCFGFIEFVALLFGIYLFRIAVAPTWLLFYHYLMTLCPWYMFFFFPPEVYLIQCEYINFCFFKNLFPEGVGGASLKGSLCLSFYVLSSVCFFLKFFFFHVFLWITWTL